MASPGTHGIAHDLAYRPRDLPGSWAVCCWYIEQSTGTATRTVAVAAALPRIPFGWHSPSNKINTPLRVEVMEVQVWSVECPQSWHGAMAILDAIILHNLAGNGR